MILLRRGHLLLLLLLLTVAMGRAAETGEPSHDERLAAGEVLVTPIAIDGFSIPELLLEMVLDAAPERVWALVDDCHGYRDTMPMVVDSIETERAGGHSLCAWTVAMPFPLADVKTVVAATSLVSEGAWRRDFQQVSGGFHRNQGSWQLAPFGADGKRTRVGYRLHAVIDTILPDALVKRGQIKALRQMVETMRAQLATPSVSP